MAFNKFVTRKGFQSLDDSNVSGSLAISGSNPLLINPDGLQTLGSEDTTLVINTSGVVGVRENAASSGTSGTSGSSGSSGSSGTTGSSGSSGSSGTCGSDG